ncbi:glutathione S-transferase kappa 1-like isoform X2 [Chelmon rostratus]|nr:glutathione S-transferase kappa 1-like isoform X2 [Chelmon rostratus]
MTSKKVVELFYDVVSAYSWLSFEVMCRYRNVWNIDLKLRPAFLGGIMQGSGNKPPVLVPNKFMYMSKDLRRLSGYFGVPLQFPSDAFEVLFNKENAPITENPPCSQSVTAACVCPSEAQWQEQSVNGGVKDGHKKVFQESSLSAMRFVAAIQEREKGGDQQVEKVSRELWRRIWSEDKDITEPKSLSEAGRKAGLSDNEIEEALVLSTSKEIKDKLKSTTQFALDNGAFGFPMLVCHVDGKPEMFFGSDRFELMAHCIGEKWVGPQPNTSARL